MDNTDVKFYNEGDLEEFQNMSNDIVKVALNSLNRYISTYFSYTNQIADSLYLFSSALSSSFRIFTAILLIIILIVGLVIIIPCMIISMILVFKCMGPALKHMSFIRAMGLAIAISLQGPFFLKDYFTGKFPCFYNSAPNVNDVQEAQNKNEIQESQNT